MIRSRHAKQGTNLVAGDFAGIRAVVNAKSLANPAKAIAQWIRQYPTLFSPGSEEGHNTRARAGDLDR